jgi:hypothetical protein
MEILIIHNYYDWAVIILIYMIYNYYLILEKFSRILYKNLFNAHEAMNDQSGIKFFYDF